MHHQKYKQEVAKYETFEKEYVLQKTETKNTINGNAFESSGLCRSP